MPGTARRPAEAAAKARVGGFSTLKPRMTKTEYLSFQRGISKTEFYDGSSAPRLPRSGRF